MTITNFQNLYPIIHKDAFIAHSADIIGNVKIGSNSSIWFGVILRGDVNEISIGENTNIQDATVIHASRLNNGATIIGNNVTVGHRAIIHASQLKDHSFVGMGSIVMDHVILESYSFIAAGAVVIPNTIVKSGQLWSGVPAKYKRDLSEEEMRLISDSAKQYIELSAKYKD